MTALLSITVYTAVSDGYDKKPLDCKPEDGVETMVRRCPEGVDPVLWNREQKILQPPKTGIASVYLDGSISPKKPIHEAVLKWLEKADMALFKHPWRTCAYAEIDECVRVGKIGEAEASKARSHLRLAGFPRDYGLWACGMVARRTHSNVLQAFVGPIWFETTSHLPRDQIWLPYVLWKIQKSINRVHTIDADIYNNKWFKFRRHGS
jgi:hypothetical protein